MIRPRKKPRKFHFSRLSCPACGERTRSVVRAGTVCVRCWCCGVLLQVTIRPVMPGRVLDAVCGVSLEHALHPPRPAVRGYTELMCPVCGRRTGVSVRTGSAVVYCRRCKTLIEITVDIIRELERAHRTDDN